MEVLKKAYSKIWKLARRYYEKGRPYDIQHIEWMMKQVEKLSKIEKFNEYLLMPICILHDIGYSKVNFKNHALMDAGIKKLHMAEGAKIAKEILGKVGYNNELLKRIIYYISVHDNWVFGDDSPFKECKEMALFNDLDFLYGISSKFALQQLAKGTGKKPEEIISLMESDEKHSRRPFCCAETKKMFKTFIKERKKEIGKT